ncbi:MAG: Uncharacterised protein [Polaribacter sp. SA4-10]|nr:MAG: Uncharacterised protein [Polaribacter sp. SA4-10]
MVKENFISILKNPELSNQEQTNELKTLIESYPYFQSARSLFLKGLKNQDSFKYNNELKVTAAYTSDRTVLFDFITSPSFNFVKNSISHELEKAILINPVIDSLEKKLAKELPENNLNIGKPLSFSNSEKRSFSEWLKLSSVKSIIREPSVRDKMISKSSIIDQFIEKKPKLKPVIKSDNIIVSDLKNESTNSLMTETLAKVYLEQKKYENAIQAYKILSLKYPEKSGFFADQIKRIQTLQKNKS